MISFLGSWIEQIIIAVIIVSILEMLLPNGNIKKYVKIILSVFVIFNIISPFVNSTDLYNISSQDLDKYASDSKILNKSNTSNVIDKSSMDKRLQELYIEELEKSIKSKLEKNGYFVNKCKVDAILDSSSSNAGINKITLVVSKNKGNIQQIDKINISENNKINRKRRKKL